MSHRFEPIEESETWKILLLKDLVSLWREAKWNSNLNINNHEGIPIVEIESSIIALCIE